MALIRRGWGLLLLMGAGWLVAAGLVALLPRHALARESLPTGEPKRVLVLESFGRDIAPWNAITPAFKKELARRHRHPIEFHEAALETAWENRPQADAAFAEYLRALYARQPPDLVVPVGAVAAQFWWRHRASVFPTAPVVIGGIENRLLRSLPLGSNDTAITAQLDLRTGPEIVFQVLPATTNVTIVIGDSILERYWIAQYEEAKPHFSNRVQLAWLNKLPFHEVCQRAAAMPPRSVLAFSTLWVDAAGVPHPQMEALDQLCAVANAPVFGLFEEQLGHGIVGGRLLSSEAIGLETAHTAARILAGESAGKISPQTIVAGPPTFDWRQLRRWKIDERRLPSGSIVHFQRPSAWERYRWYICGALGIILLQALTIVALLAQRSRRQRAELVAQRHRNELLHIGRVQVLGQFASALAHELNQPLGAILSNAEAAELLLQKPNPALNDVREIVADIRKDDQHASEVIQRMRALLRRHEMELKPLAVDELIAASIALTRQDASERGVTVASEVLPQTPRVRGDRVHLQQVLLNLLVNALDAMHECPTERRRLLIRAAPTAADTVMFSVEDAGPGIPPDQLARVFESFHTTKANGLGVGLSISRTIVEAHCGKIWAENNPQGGATFRFTLPADVEAEPPLPPKFRADEKP